LLGDYKYGSSASQRNPSRASTTNKLVVGQPIGLQIVAQNLTSQAAKNIKFTGWRASRKRATGPALHRGGPVARHDEGVSLQAEPRERVLEATYACVARFG